MDFSNLDTAKKANEGTFLHLKHPGSGVRMHEGCDPATGAGGDPEKKVGVWMLGKDSNKHAARTHKRNNARILATDTQTVTSEESESDTIDMICNLAIGWQHIQLPGGENIFNEKNVKEFFTQFKWAAEQAIEHSLTRSNFI